MLVLFVAAFWPRRRRDAPGAGFDSGPPPARVDVAARVAGVLAGLGAAWLLCGWWGLAAGLVAGAVAARGPRTARVIGVFGAMFAATVLLAAGPWHSGLPYTGYDPWPQMAALIALSVLVAGLVVPPPEPPERPGPGGEGE